MPSVPGSSNTPSLAPARIDVGAPIAGLSQVFNGVCPGTLVQAVPVLVGQTPVGSLQVRRSSQGFCALVQVDRPGVAAVNALQALAPSPVAPPAVPEAGAPSSTRPARLWMYAVVQRCAASGPSEGAAAGWVCRDELSIHDEGMFYFYAGPVLVAPHGLCVRAEGRIAVTATVEGFAQTAPSPALCA